jgi:hypothetical protein
VFKFTPRTLYLKGNRPRYSLFIRMGGLQKPSECFGEEKNFLPLPGIESRLLDGVFNVDMEQWRKSIK